MAERNEILKPAEGSIGNPQTFIERQVTVLPDGKVLIGRDANFHPIVGVAGDSRDNRLRFKERPGRV